MRGMILIKINYSVNDCSQDDLMGNRSMDDNAYKPKDSNCQSNTPSAVVPVLNFLGMLNKGAA